MFAAASGNSTIGIPQSVGKEFVAADKARGKSDFHTAMAHHGVVRGSGDHKRHPSTQHYKGPSVAQARYGK